MSAADVNAAMKAHIHPKDLVIVIISPNGKALAQKLAANTPSPKTYSSPKPQSVLDEDKLIEVFPLDLPRNRITVVPAATLFAE